MRISGKMENVWDIQNKCDEKARPRASILNMEDTTDKLMELILSILSLTQKLGTMAILIRQVYVRQA